MCFTLIAARSLPAEPALLGCSPVAPTLCQYLWLLFRTSADGELAGRAGVAERSPWARCSRAGGARGHQCPPAAGAGAGGGVPTLGAGGGQEGRAEQGSFLTALALTGMGIIKMGSWAAALAPHAVTYVTGGRNPRSRNF